MCSALTGSNRFASWLKFDPGEFVILGVLPATLRAPAASTIAPVDFVNSDSAPTQPVIQRKKAAESLTRAAFFLMNWSG